MADSKKEIEESELRIMRSSWEILVVELRGEKKEATVVVEKRLETTSGQSWIKNQKLTSKKEKKKKKKKKPRTQIESENKRECENERVLCIWWWWWW